MSALYVTLAAMGFFGGGHCAVMCGGASAALCSVASKRSVQGLVFNVGRVAGYAMLGGLAGMVGTLASGFVPLDVVRVALRAFTVLCMLAVGLHLAGFPSLVTALERVGGPVWKRVGPRLQPLLPLRKASHALVAGTMWALMPCGLLYSALALAASAGSAPESALAMLAFGAGTLPAMLLAGATARRAASATQRPWVRRLAGVVVIALGLLGSAGTVRAAMNGMLAPTTPHACCPGRH